MCYIDVSRHTNVVISNRKEGLHFVNGMVTVK